MKGLTARHGLVGDVLAAKEVLSDHLVNFLDCVFVELILAHIELDDSIVLHQSALQSGSSVLFDLVRADVQLANRSIVTDILRQTLAEEVAQQVGCQI